MNERIKELIEQAGFEEKDGHISIQGVYMFNTYRMEKFAELIIAECCVTADANIDESKYPSYWIKKKFGVEEPKGWVCSKCGTDRTKAACPQGPSAAVDGSCPMIGFAQ